MYDMAQTENLTRFNRQDTSKLLQMYHILDLKENKNNVLYTNLQLEAEFVQYNTTNSNLLET